MHNDIEDILTRGVANIVPDKKHLAKLLTSKKITIYAGFDATAPRLHLGHTVPFRKLQRFAKLGHKVIFLIGDFTTLVGDNSDKETERPILTSEEIKNNWKDFKKQASKILDFSLIEVKKNSDWLSKLTFSDVVKITQQFSVGDFIGRELVRKRLYSGGRVGLHEMLYPIMQGYDHYYLDADLQIGATEQTFNLQAGRTLQKYYRAKESYFMTLDILEGTDGKKMSKSVGNCIWLMDDPSDMYGKVMNISDSLIESYFILATDTPTEVVKTIIGDLKSGKVHPMETKKLLAHTIVTELHDTTKANQAQEAFKKTFQDKKPDFTKNVKNEGTLAKTIAPFTSLASVSESKRQITQGAVSVNEQVIRDPHYKTSSGQNIKLGKKIFLKVV
ncbi:tyrosine--tRNA ligase [Candidatus Woesebacteria bacterium]|nr:MAG: tyrosine--tRNA ligase [Candidatus Woesebacteria bacterium]